MGYVRVALPKRGRLVRVLLADVDERKRLLVSRRLREHRWSEELRPDFGYRPTMSQRLAALNEAVELEQAALYPSDRAYLVPEEEAAKALENKR